MTLNLKVLSHLQVDMNGAFVFTYMQFLAAKSR